MNNTIMQFIESNPLSKELQIACFIYHMNETQQHCFMKEIKWQFKGYHYMKYINNLLDWSIITVNPYEINGTYVVRSYSITEHAQSLLKQLYEQFVEQPLMKA